MNRVNLHITLADVAVAFLDHVLVFGPVKLEFGILLLQDGRVWRVYGDSNDVADNVNHKAQTRDLRLRQGTIMTWITILLNMHLIQKYIKIKATYLHIEVI